MEMMPTVFPADDFDPTADAKTLKQAFKGFGSDEKAIIDVIARRSLEQRLAIAETFKTMYGKDLIKELKSELSGNFEDCIIALMTHPIEYQAKHLHKSISGMGTDEKTLIEILAIHTNDEVKMISDAYESMYNNTLERDIKGDTSGTVKRLLVSLSVGGRDESDEIDPEAAYKDAQSLLRAGELQLGTDESAFNMVMCQRNRPQLRTVFDEYEKLVGHSIETAIENEFSGTAKESLISLVHCIRDRTDYLVTRLFDAMDGLGTNDRTLIRIIATRCELDLGAIKAEFESKYSKSLADAVRDETSGDYKKCLLILIG